MSINYGSIMKTTLNEYCDAHKIVNENNNDTNEYEQANNIIRNYSIISIMITGNNYQINRLNSVTEKTN